MASAVLLAALAACADGAAPSAPSESAEPGYVAAGEPSVVDACMQEGDVALEIEGRGLEALAYGEGDVGVLLAHGLGQGPCSWDAFGRALAEEGLSVLAPQLGTNDPARDLQLGEDWLLAHGAERVAIVGASAGAAHAIVAAAEIEPAPVALVGLSPPTTYGSSDALEAIAEVEAPVLLIADEGDADFAASAVRLGDEQPHAEVVILDHGGHGTQLVEDPAVRDRVLALLAEA